ncbi:hypothetical protein K2173_002861 [Erythroxylum novogranatense]|uniref:RRM domain-containing protein n=1 Tax=Erythroxylum novogranatense TaxID=1862640 RepID=A0AAV8SR50_9ROSI|nr:hypothetical protein K2173_002861 [Erythroxylum novogranatense]
MAALQAALSTFSFDPFVSSSSSKLLSSSKPLLLSLKAPIPVCGRLFLNNFPLYSEISNCSTSRKLWFKLCSAAHEITVETKTEQTQEENQKRKLFVLNLPWSCTVADIKELFGRCGAVSDVEVIKQKSGRSRGFSFVTMSSGEEAQAAIDKFDSYEVSGRIIRVQFAKRLKKFPPPSQPGVSGGETRHKLYVSNLAWKVRSGHLRDFFSANFKPVSSRVIFDSPSGRSAGYGFVSFGTREEAEAAISALDGKDLMGRPLRLKFSEKRDGESESEKQDEESPDVQREA